MKFILWLVSFLAILSSLYFSFELGWLEYLWEVDKSKLSFAILSLSLMMYSRLGFLLYYESKVSITEEDLDPGNEASTICVALGMLGTVIGLIIATDPLSSITNTEDIKQFTHDLCLHITALRPLFLKPEDVDETFISRERDVLKEQLANSGKPEKLIDQII